ncbi:hypothetical protein R1flu_026976 [Riccia fluitans]|uniref:Secreted protein n=1 Tax=Riccia fluitans TaxID=41844 RepID=A0ABD1XI68_9MARC
MGRERFFMFWQLVLLVAFQEEKETEARSSRSDFSFAIHPASAPTGSRLPACQPSVTLSAFESGSPPEREERSSVTDNAGNAVSPFHLTNCSSSRCREVE